MSNLLDLDGILPPKRTVKLSGQEHDLRQMSLKDFIAITRESEILGKEVAAGTKTQADVIEANLNSLRYMLPTLSDEQLADLTPDQVLAIMTFARETAAAGAPESGAGEGTSGK